MSNKTRKKQIENQAQQGRSMVEMLGVLAIIGVLSIGGIAGYRMAMNRHQANQIANEINLMRTDAKVKVAQGAEKLMLGEPYDSGHLNFGTNYEVDFDFIDIKSEDEGVTEAGYYIKISGVSAGVCKPLVTLLNGMNETVALKVNDGEYSADSSVDFCTEESNNALEVDFSTEKIISNSGEEPEPPEEQGDEPQDPECNEDTCPEGTCNDEGVCECSGENENWTGTDCITCPTGTTWSETERDCVCSDENKYWTGYQCVTCDASTGGTWDEENKECKCNDENKYWSDSAGACIENPCNHGQGCPVNQFCLSSTCSGCSSGTITESCSKYECKSISEYTAENKDSEHPDKYVMTKDGKYMNWWSAERFCNALGKHMVSATELKCKDRFGEDFGYGKSNTWCYCHNDESEKTCRQSSTSEVSSVIKALRKAENGTETKGNHSYWLYDAYANTTSSKNSCNAYFFYLGDGQVVSSARNNYGSYYVLCE